MTRALITGCTGQDGTYLAELLAAAGYEVWGLVRGQEHLRLPRLLGLVPGLRVIGGDLLDPGSLRAAILESQPDEVYNLAAVTLTSVSWPQPTLTSNVNALGVLHLLEALRACGADRTRVYQAGTSEMFGLATTTPQSESTPFHPRNPYGVAKVYAHHLAVSYRETYGMPIWTGILFNHTSPRHGEVFLPRKVARGAVRCRLGLTDRLPLGDLDARRDWGFAGDYVRAMHLMLQDPEPDTYVVGTGETHTIRELATAAFAAVDLDWQEYVRQDPRLVRPAEIVELRADTTRARERLGWSPTLGFKELVRQLVEAERQREQSYGMG